MPGTYMEKFADDAIFIVRWFNGTDIYEENGNGGNGALIKVFWMKMKRRFYNTVQR